MDFIFFIKCLELANPLRQEVGWELPVMLSAWRHSAHFLKGSDQTGMFRTLVTKIDLGSSVDQIGGGGEPNSGIHSNCFSILEDLNLNLKLWNPKSDLSGGLTCCYEWKIPYQNPVRGTVSTLTHWNYCMKLDLMFRSDCHPKDILLFTQTFQNLKEPEVCNTFCQKYFRKENSICIINAKG